MLTVLTLLAYGCPIQAVVAAFGLDERTVAAWQQRAGAQGRRIHEHLVQAGRVELGQVQAEVVSPHHIVGRIDHAVEIAVRQKRE